MHLNLSRALPYLRPIRLCAAALLAALSLVAVEPSTALLAAIQILPPGSGIQTFDSPPATSEWSTILTGISDTTSSIGQITDPGELLFVVNQVGAANVSDALPTSNLLAPTANQAARYSTPGQFVQTYATTSMATVLMATLRNSTGGKISQLTVEYDLAEVLDAGENIDEQIPGHVVLFSNTGAPDSWEPIDLISMAGRASFSVAPLEWINGTDAYVLWADDNSIPGATAGEAAYTIDNVSFSPLIIPPDPPGLINFENVPGVTPATNFILGSEVPASARLSTQLLGSHGVRFRTEAPGADYVALVDLGQGHATSGENGIGGVNGANRLSYTGPTLFSFFMPGDSSTPAVTDFFSIRGDTSGGSGDVVLEAYDINYVLLERVTGINSGGGTYSISRPGIHLVRLTESTSTMALDDLIFNPLQPVPEPSTLCLGFIGVLSLIGWGMRSGRGR